MARKQFVSSKKIAPGRGVSSKEAALHGRTNGAAGGDDDGGDSPRDSMDDESAVSSGGSDDDEDDEEEEDDDEEEEEDRDVDGEVEQEGDGNGAAMEMDDGLALGDGVVAVQVLPATVGRGKQLRFPTGISRGKESRVLPHGSDHDGASDSDSYASVPSDEEGDAEVATTSQRDQAQDTEEMEMDMERVLSSDVANGHRAQEPTRLESMDSSVVTASSSSSSRDKRRRASMEMTGTSHSSADHTNSTTKSMEDAMAAERDSDGTVAYPIKAVRARKRHRPDSGYFSQMSTHVRDCLLSVRDVASAADVFREDKHQVFRRKLSAGTIERVQWKEATPMPPTVVDTAATRTATTTASASATATHETKEEAKKPPARWSPASRSEDDTVEASEPTRKSHKDRLHRAKDKSSTSSSSSSSNRKQSSSAREGKGGDDQHSSSHNSSSSRGPREASSSSSYSRRERSKDRDRDRDRERSSRASESKSNGTKRGDKGSEAHDLLCAKCQSRLSAAEIATGATVGNTNTNSSNGNNNSSSSVNAQDSAVTESTTASSRSRSASHASAIATVTTTTTSTGTNTDPVSPDQEVVVPNSSFVIPPGALKDIKKLRDQASKLNDEARALKHEGNDKGASQSGSAGQIAQGKYYLRSGAKFFQHALLLADIKAAYREVNDRKHAQTYGDYCVKTLAQTTPLIESTIRMFQSAGSKRLVAVGYKLASVVHLAIYRLQHLKLFSFYSEVFTPGRSPDSRSNGTTPPINSSSSENQETAMRTHLLKEMEHTLRGFEMWRRYEACGVVVLPRITNPAVIDLNMFFEDLEAELNQS